MTQREPAQLVRPSNRVRHPGWPTHSLATDTGQRRAVCFVRGLWLVWNQGSTIFWGWLPKNSQPGRGRVAFAFVLAFQWGCPHHKKQYARLIHRRISEVQAHLRAFREVLRVSNGLGAPDTHWIILRHLEALFLTMWISCFVFWGLWDCEKSRSTRSDQAGLIRTQVAFCPVWGRRDRKQNMVDTRRILKVRTLLGPIANGFSSGFVFQIHEI